MKSDPGVLTVWWSFLYQSFKNKCLVILSYLFDHEIGQPPVRLLQVVIDLDVHGLETKGEVNLKQASNKAAFYNI